jgi:hypothetical protein
MSESLRRFLASTYFAINGQKGGKMKKVSGLLFCVALLLGLYSTSGAYTVPYNISNLSAFLSNSTYFNGHTPVAEYDFGGWWQYTAIATEAAHTNVTEEATSGPFTFRTDIRSNWGLWDTVDFTSKNLYFTDLTDSSPANVALDALSGGSKYFQLYQLTAPSNTLRYLANPIVLAMGTYILGWNDNLFPAGGDLDYDDMVIAMRPAPVPEPATMILLGLGLVGLSGLSRKMRKS